jgi:hypothetical protein
MCTASKVRTLFTVRMYGTEPVFVDVYGHLGFDSKNRFHMKN